MPRISQARELIGYLVTEPGAGSDVKGISCKAERSGSYYIVNGRKTFATNGAVARLYCVLAKTRDNELTFFVVDRESHGLSIGKPQASKIGT